MSDPVQELRRWEDSGAHWRVLERTPERVVVQLLMCTGEEEGQIESDDPALLAHLGDRTRSDS